MTAPADQGDIDTADDVEAQQALADADQQQQSSPSQDGDWDPERARRRWERMKADQDKLRARIKELEPAARQLKELQDKDKSELEKLQQAFAEKGAEVERLTLATLRRDAVLAAGLTAEDMEFLTGSTPEEIEAQAKKLAQRLAPPKPQRSGGPDLKQGQRGPASTGAPVDKNALLRQWAGFSANNT